MKLKIYYLTTIIAVILSIIAFFFDRTISIGILAATLASMLNLFLLSASMKAMFGKHYDAVKKKASWVINEAQLCWQGKRPSGIRRMAHYGADYKIVQKQINRSVKGRSFNFSKL